jgi:dephospho-CoA kinase
MPPDSMMKVLGLTGGVGMGKSAAADLLSKMGVPLADSDVLARQVVQPGQPALTEIQAAFGADAVGLDGSLRRDELARRVFADPQQRRLLESILHPRIRTLWQAQVDQWRNEGCALGVVVIPLLFETDAADELDATICVACSVGTQWERLRARGWTPEEIQQRIQSQWPIEQKMARADYVVWNEACLAVLEAQLQRILTRCHPDCFSTPNRTWAPSCDP